MVIQKSGSKGRKKVISVGSGQRILTFLVFLCSLGGGEGPSLSEQWTNTRKSSAPHTMPTMASITQQGLDCCQVAIALFRGQRRFSMI